MPIPNVDGSAIRVLFLCVHNAARSRMAETLLRNLGGDSVSVESAGFEPSPVNPLAIEAMRTMGQELSLAPSQAVFDLFRAGRRYDYVITVCDESNGERCPVFPGFTQRLHWSFPDPAMLEGTPEERLAATIEIGHAIRNRIVLWLEHLGSQ